MKSVRSLLINVNDTSFRFTIAISHHFPTLQHGKWGGEDHHIHNAAESTGFITEKFPLNELVHMSHTHAKSWDVSGDVSLV